MPHQASGTTTVQREKSAAASECSDDIWARQSGDTQTEKNIGGDRDGDNGQTDGQAN